MRHNPPLLTCSPGVVGSVAATAGGRVRVASATADRAVAGFPPTSTIVGTDTPPAAPGPADADPVGVR
jgi:hypothetical protein